MKITKNRHLAILFYFISINRNATSKQLSEFTSSSIRTIKSDIAIINELLDEDKICTIDSTKAKGYVLRVLDEDNMEGFSYRIKSQYSFYKNESLEKMSRRIYIIQRILSSRNVKIDDIADELYLTRSALRDDLSWVTEFFKSYDLDIVVKPSKGLFYSGEEEKIRSIMVETFCSQYHNLQDRFLVKEFNDMFYEDNTYYEYIRHRLLKIIRESDYSMRDINTKKMATYIVLIKNRIKNNHNVKIDSEIKREIEFSYELGLAKEIVKIPDLYNDINISEDEVYVIAKRLICLRDIDITVNSDIKTIKPIYIKEISDICDIILNDISNELGNSLYKLELFARYRKRMISFLYPIYMLKKYDSTYKKVLTTYYEIANYEFSPIAIEMARIFLIKAGEVFETEFNSYMANSYILMLELMLEKINYSYKKRKLAILSCAGRAIAGEYKDRLSEMFDDFIEYMHVFNQYEMRRIDFNDYDIAIGDNDPIFNYYPIKIVNSNLLNIGDPTLPLFNKVFRGGYIRTEVDKLIDITTIYDSFECTGYHILFKMLSFKYAHMNTNKFEERLLAGEKTFSYLNSDSEIAMIMCDYKLTNREFVDVYTSENKMMWDKQREVKYIFVVSIDNNINAVNLKVVNKILQVLYHKPEFVGDLLQDKEKTYNNIFNKIITNHFISK